jgi:hypothetical protein
MKWIPDKSGRFAQRPHYTPAELDAECDRVISTFLRRKYGKVVFPISTDDLTVLIEEKADLDTYADLSREGADVEGVTEFRPGKKPLVKISEVFGEAAHRENRLRTTLTHEYGHVHFHSMMFDEVLQPGVLLPGTDKPRINKCNRDSIVSAVESNWMEWQAGYACSALLIPASALKTELLRICTDRKMAFKSIGVTSPDGIYLIDAVAEKFQTSKDAARVRLLKQGVLADGAGSGMSDLFS